jgi:hypothetical protein
VIVPAALVCLIALDASHLIKQPVRSKVTFATMPLP